MPAGIAIFVPRAAPGRADAGRGGDRDRRRDRRPASSRRWSCCGRGWAACRRPPRWPGSRSRLWLPFVAARLVPGQGKIVGFAVMALTGLTYVAVLVVTREFGPEDRAKFAKVFKR